ncbi:MAG: efflux transporter periplasmic adaptor subunit [Gammaproteobacteria bacterium]|nr:MAG: efflux transporter periplasmic adaptor subunit [Gammaproteobacteria bacterium]
MNKFISALAFIIVGVIAGYFAQPFIQGELGASGSSGAGAGNGEKKIKYWVAPMDANYRRDKPGKSPMGMDLVPVYEDEDGGDEDGVVKISPAVQNNIGVRIGEVKKGQLTSLLETVGYVGFDEEKLYNLHTRVEGWVEKLLVKAAGDVVSKGQKLFELYSPTLVNAQEEYITALKSGNALLMGASKDRLISLGVSADQIAELRRTRKARQRIVYHAEQSGFIEKLMVREGAFVKPAMEVLSIGQLDTVWVIAEVLERQSGEVSKGQDVDMTVEAYPGVVWQGKVDYIYPILDEKTRTLRVRIRFDNPDELLKPNMFSQLTIKAPFESPVLYVKREAIIRNGRMNRVVKALGDGKFKSVVVRTGREAGNYVEILDGLKQGDKIVTSAQFLIDSESSLTAGFDRMEEPQTGGDMAMQKKPKPKQVWIDAEVKKVMASDHKINVEHQPVDAWGWPSMVMDFPVSNAIKLDDLKPAEKLRMLVERHDDGSVEVVKLEAVKGDEK